MNRRDPVEEHPLWRNRDYMLLWSGQAISTVGTGVTQIALPLLVLGLTHSPASAGLVSALAAAPYIVVGLLAGALVDRWDRRVVMIICDLCRAAILASIPLVAVAGHLTIVQLYLVALLVGTFDVFFGLAEAAALPRVVGRDRLVAANAQNRITFDVAGLIGPGLGGALYGLGRTLPFVVDTMSYAGSVLGLLAIRTRFQGERKSRESRLSVEIMEGLHFLWHTPVIRVMAFINSGIGFTMHGITLILIVLAQSQHAPPAGIGIMLSIGSAGGVLGALMATRVRARFRFGEVIAGVLWLWALLLPLYSIAPNPIALGAVTALIMMVDPFYDVVQYSYRLALIPDALQGRVNSAFRLIAWSTRPLGIALTGVLIQSIGARGTVFFFAACLLFLAIAATLNPHVRSAGTVATA